MTRRPPIEIVATYSARAAEAVAGDPRGFDRAIQVRDALSFPTEKPPAMVTIDDRALCFTGNWNDFDPKRLLEFKPWNKSQSLGSTINVSRSANLIRRIQMAKLN